MKTSNMAILGAAVLVIAGLWLYSSTRNEELRADAPALLAVPAAETLAAQAGVDRAQHAQSAAAGSPAREVETEAGVVPIPVSPEFSRILTNQRPGISSDTTAKLHAKLESQPRDPVWAPETEETFRRFFEGKPELLRYGVPSVECRTDLCEVRLAAYGADRKMDWFQLMTKPGTALLPRGGFPVNTQWDEQDGVTAIILHWMYKGRQD